MPERHPFMITRATSRSGAALVLAVCIALGGCGSPESSPSQPASPSAPDAELVLIEPGATQAIEVVDANGSFGTVTIERGEDVGGYPMHEIDPATFVIEVSFAYEIDRHPIGEFGRPDWAVANGPNLMPVGGLFEAPMPPNPADWDPERQELGIFPGAMEVSGERLTGMLYFLVPRDVADQPLQLVYTPNGADEAAASFLLREPGPAPDLVAAATPEAEAYVAQPGLPFTVLESPEADALFVDADTCTNPEDGYTVSYPDSWYTNTAIGDIPACSWFSPTFYELNPDGSRPEEIAIEITLFEGVLGFIWVDLYSEEVTLGGFDARRYETGMTKEVSMPSDTFLYAYLSYLGDPDSEGRKLSASTGTEYGGSYELNRAVLDRIMASLEFDN